MAWPEITRRKYRRDGLRYASHLTDTEWALIEPLLPPASPLGRPRETDLRSVMNAILYMASTCCQWRQLPKEFPPYSTVQGYFYAWSRDACSRASIMLWSWRCARRPDGRRGRLRASSTASR
jgi:putative transposase